MLLSYAGFGVFMATPNPPHLASCGSVESIFPLTGRALPGSGGSRRSEKPIGLRRLRERALLHIHEMAAKPIGERKAGWQIVFI